MFTDWGLLALPLPLDLSSFSSTKWEFISSTNVSCALRGAGDIAVSQTDQGRVYPGQETGQTQPPFFPTSNTPVLDRVLFKMFEYTVTTKHCQAPALRVLGALHAAQGLWLEGLGRVGGKGGRPWGGGQPEQGSVHTAGGTTAGLGQRNYPA